MYAECPECIEIRNFDGGLRNKTEIFAASPAHLWYVALNGKISPFHGRVYALLGRHLSKEEAKYSLGSLTDSEALDFRDLNFRIATALMEELGCLGIKRIQNFMKNDAAHSSHPDFDFMPVYQDYPYGTTRYLSLIPKTRTLHKVRRYH